MLLVYNEPHEVQLHEIHQQHPGWYFLCSEGSGMPAEKVTDSDVSP